MHIVSKEFMNAMGSHPYIAKITIDGGDVIQGSVVQELIFRGGANASEDTVLLGSAFAASVEITLDRNEVNCAIEGRELFVELGIVLPGGVEWLPMGRYTAQDPAEADGVLTVIAMDALGAKFHVDYEPLEGFDFAADGGVLSTDFLVALCNRRGVAVDLDRLAPIALHGEPTGFTERQIIGFISALYGGFANVDRQGVLRIRKYAPVDVTVSPDSYYEDGLQKATYSFTPGWLKCYNEAAGLTMFVGDMDATQGINLESIWMNQATLNSLWEQLVGFVYRPVPELSFLGNPLIDPGDILTLQDAAGEFASVPVMAVTHEYDGGIKTSVSACGQAKTADHQGPTRRAVFRNAESARRYTDRENEKLNQEELLRRLTNTWADDGIYLTEDGKLAIKATAIKGGAIMAEGWSILPPTHDDVGNMLWALLFPDRFEVKDFYDLNGDGVFDNQDLDLANDIYMGIRDITEARSLTESKIAVLIEPSNTEAPVKISGVNMWGSQVDMLIGINGSKIPRIVGDCAVSGRLSVGNDAVFSKLALNNFETTKSLEWKDNGDGTFTLIGREVVSQ